MTRVTDDMHRVECRSLELQFARWVRPNLKLAKVPGEW